MAGDTTGELAGKCRQAGRPSQDRSKTPTGRAFNAKADDPGAREVRVDSEHRKAAHFQ